jgi:hypothetical protein
MQKSLDGDAKAEFVKDMYAKVRKEIEAQTARNERQANKGRKEVIFQPGDWVWLHFRQERFPSKRKTKLHPRGDGPFEVIRRLNNNAYQIAIPPEWGVSNSINISGLKRVDINELDLFDNPYDLRSDPLKLGGNDVIQESIPHPLDPIPRKDHLIIGNGPETRSQRKNRLEALNLLITDLVEIKPIIEKELIEKLNHMGCLRVQTCVQKVQTCV